MGTPKRKGLERIGVGYYVRGAGAAWLAATLDPGERLQVDCGSVHAGLLLDDIYEDTGLLVVQLHRGYGRRTSRPGCMSG